MKNGHINHNNVISQWYIINTEYLSGFGLSLILLKWIKI